MERARQRFRKQWRLRCLAVAPSVEEAGEEFFPVLSFPPSQWQGWRTTTAVERMNEEVRRRTTTPASLPSEEAVLLFLFGLLRSGQITLRRLVDWKDLPPAPTLIQAQAT